CHLPCWPIALRHPAGVTAGDPRDKARWPRSANHNPAPRRGSFPYRARACHVLHHARAGCPTWRCAFARRDPWPEKTAAALPRTHPYRHSQHRSETPPHRRP
ncbi:MAG: hypothetical protein ACK56F_27395, partial [bacterium]